MGDRLRGVYEHDRRLITLNTRMTTAQARHCLAHELGHAWHGHRWSGDPHEDTASERLADDYAARLLVDRQEYARAETLVGSHPGALAVELGLTRDVVAAWQRLERHRA